MANQELIYASRLIFFSRSNHHLAYDNLKINKKPKESFSAPGSTRRPLGLRVYLRNIMHPKHFLNTLRSTPRTILPVRSTISPKEDRNWNSVKAKNSCESQGSYN